MMYLLWVCVLIFLVDISTKNQGTSARSNGFNFLVHFDMSMIRADREHSASRPKSVFLLLSGKSCCHMPSKRLKVVDMTITDIRIDLNF